MNEFGVVSKFSELESRKVSMKRKNRFHPFSVDRILQNDSIPIPGNGVSVENSLTTITQNNGNNFFVS